MLGILAKLSVKPGREAEFERVAEQLAEQVNAREPGCLFYAAFRGEAEGEYLFMESYADQAALDAHRATEHSRSAGQIVATLLRAPPSVTRLTPIGEVREEP